MERIVMELPLILCSCWPIIKVPTQTTTQGYQTNPGSVFLNYKSCLFTIKIKFFYVLYTYRLVNNVYT